MRMFGISLLLTAALILGALTGYFFANAGFAGRASALQDQLDAIGKAARASTAENQELRVDIDAKNQLINEQQAKIAELEAALQVARSRTIPATEPTLLPTDSTSPEPEPVPVEPAPSMLTPPIPTPPSVATSPPRPAPTPPLPPPRP